MCYSDVPPCHLRTNLSQTLFAWLVLYLCNFECILNAKHILRTISRGEKVAYVPTLRFHQSAFGLRYLIEAENIPCYCFPAFAMIPFNDESLMAAYENNKDVCAVLKRQWQLYYISTISNQCCRPANIAAVKEAFGLV